MLTSVLCIDGYGSDNIDSWMWSAFQASTAGTRSRNCIFDLQTTETNDGQKLVETPRAKILATIRGFLFFGALALELGKAL